MYLRCNRRLKHGKEHRYWSIVGRASAALAVGWFSGQFCIWARSTDGQPEAWCRLIVAFNEDAQQRTQLAFVSRRTSGAGMDGGRAAPFIRALACFVSVHAAIEARLTDSALDAGTVAAVAGISVRCANDVLAKNETSLVRLVQARRLERSRRALQDPSRTHRTVSEMPTAGGFPI
jgi:hypothetical protein